MGIGHDLIIMTLGELQPINTEKTTLEHQSDTGPKQQP